MFFNTFKMNSKLLSFVGTGALVLSLSTANAQVDIPLGSNTTASAVETLESAVSRGVYPGRGSRGESVRELQQALKDLGYSVTVDGDFGPSTQRALRSFQRSNNLRADGVLGPDSLKSLKQGLEQRSAQAAEQEAAAAADSGAATTEEGSTPGTAETEGGAGALADALGLDYERPTEEAGAADAENGALQDAVDAGNYPRMGDSGPAVEELQRRLNDAGIEAPSNGEFDQATQDAVRELQNRQGADSDGVVGPQTMDALSREENGEEAPQGTQNWMDIARSQLGVREISGSRHNPTIQAYHAQAGMGSRQPDETPWCSSFTNWVMKRAGHGGTNRANARSWLNYGRRLSRPVPGCIVVFWRGSRNGWQGHVAFYVGDNGSSIRVLGGNQSNSVNIANYSKSRILGYRWPSNVPTP